MRFQSFNRSGASRLWHPRMLSLLVAIAAIAAVAISATGSSAAKSTAKAAASSSPPVHTIGGTTINGVLPKLGTTAATGGTLSFGQITGQTPTDIDPIINGATCSTQTFEFVADQYIPLYDGPQGAQPEVDEAASAAEPAKWSNGDKTVTLTVKPGLKWSNGKPVDAQDVVFSYYILKAATDESPANWCQYASSTDFPYNVKSISAKGTNTVVMDLTHAVNPNWFVTNQLQDTNGGLYPLPATDWNVNAAGKHLTDWATNKKDAKAIWDNLDKAGQDISGFATNPLWKVVDGAYKLQSFNTTNSSFVLVPNSSYGLSPKSRVAQVDVNTYTSSTAMLNALESGSLDIGNLDPGSQLGSIPTLVKDGYTTYGSPQWGFYGGFINFKDTANDFNKVVAQNYIRGVFAQLIDEKAIIADVYHGWAAAAYGPVPTEPKSSFIPANASKPYYSYNPGQAVKTLKAHGWDVKPGGETTCAKPGTSASECGAGIPKGTPIKFSWANVPKSTAATGPLESEAVASEALQAAGIDISFQTKTFNFLVSDYNDQNPASKKYTSDWGVNNYGGITQDYYPTQEGLMNTTGALNLGAYADPTANKLMVESTESPSTSAISKEITYFDKSEPLLYMPDEDWIMVVNKKVGGSLDGFTEMTQQQVSFNLLYLNK